jgi:hypothetical protein
LQRIDNEATVGCFLARKRWRLQCIDGNWHGIVGTCRDGKFYELLVLPFVRRVTADVMTHIDK